MSFGEILYVVARINNFYLCIINHNVLEPRILPSVLQLVPVPASARVHYEPRLERPQVQAAAVLPHTALHGGRRARYTIVQVCIYSDPSSYIY